MRYILFAVLILANVSCYARDKAGKASLSPLTRNYFGTTIDITYKWYSARHSTYAGLGFLINPRDKDVKPNALFAYKAYATNLIERFSIRCGYELDIIRREGGATLFTFGELTIANTKLKVEEYFNAIGNNSYNVDSFFVYETNEVRKDQNATFVNVNIGLGFEVPVTGEIYFQTRAGVSPGLILYKFFPGDRYRGWTTIASHMFYSLTLNYEL